MKLRETLVRYFTGHLRCVKAYPNAEDALRSSKPAGRGDGYQSARDELHRMCVAPAAGRAGIEDHHADGL